MPAELKPARLPRTFQSLGTLRVLNVASVGLALAAVTVAAFARSFTWDLGEVGVEVGLPTLVFGALWAWLLRRRETVGNGRIRWGWLASLPLAILNAATACAMALSVHGSDSPESFVTRYVTGLVVGATLGAIVWVPALLLTLAFFGIPIAWAQSLAKKGLAGEERGEIVVGVTSAVLATVGLLSTWKTTVEGAPPTQTVVSLVGHVLLWLFGIGAVATGACAAVLALRREARRRRFVKEVEAGKVTGFRVDAAPEGKVLVRVTSMGQGYRVANFEEAVFALDEEGEAKQAKTALP